jgi:uncharacterized protein YcbX
MGQRHDAVGLRFRGNLYVSGLEPWEEFSLTGKTVRIGKTRLKLLAPGAALCGHLG